MTVEHYEIIFQEFKLKDARRTSCLIDGRFKKGFKLDNVRSQLKSLDITLSQLSTKINLIKSSRIGGIKILGINYSINARPQSRTSPSIGSITYSAQELENVSSSLIDISLIPRDALSLRHIISQGNHELEKNIGFIGDLSTLDDIIIERMIDEVVIENFCSITEDYKELSYEENWSKINDGYIRFGIDRQLICEEHCIGGDHHNLRLSDLDIQRPWALEQASNCDYCDSRMIMAPPYTIFNEEYVDPKTGLIIPDKRDPIRELFISKETTESKTIKHAIRNAINLGFEAASMTNLLFERELKEQLDIYKLMILPREIFYESNGREYKIMFDQLSDRQFKSTLARDKPNILKFRIYEKTQTI